MSQRMPCMKFFLIRHAETTANAGRIVIGGREGGKLSERGRRQAAALARRLSHEKVSAIYCSTSNRAMQTAHAIALHQGCDILYCDELCEIDTGELTGLSHEQIEGKYPRIFDRIFDNPAKKLPGGESLKDVQRRAMPLIERLSAREGNPTIVAVGHNVVNRVIIASLIGLPLEKCRNIKQKNACRNLLDVKKGFAQVYTVDNSLHSIK
ncbi:2,3-bisphosphoglycerate-dependent phosphoglycerate mutase [uncultured archaeon]|nr:2,3-bisphosphoglycerate-dependent phosphoglycerate mutase [uncultured archaeon]